MYKHVNTLTLMYMWLDLMSLHTLYQRWWNNNKIVHLYVFVKMHWLVVDVVPHEEVADAGQEGHLRQGEYVHELFHGVAMGTLQDSD